MFTITIFCALTGYHRPVQQKRLASWCDEKCSGGTHEGNSQWPLGQVSLHIVNCSHCVRENALLIVKSGEKLSFLPSIYEHQFATLTLTENISMDEWRHLHIRPCSFFLVLGQLIVEFCVFKVRVIVSTKTLQLIFCDVWLYIAMQNLTLLFNNYSTKTK